MLRELGLCAGTSSAAWQRMSGRSAPTARGRPAAAGAAPQKSPPTTRAARRAAPLRVLQTQTTARASSPAAGGSSKPALVRPQYQVDEFFYSERGQREWVAAMELDALTRRGGDELPRLLLELGANYDPQRLADSLASKRGAVYARAARVAGSLGAFFARLARDYALGSFDTNMETRASELRSLLGGLGPSFVKIGQALSARPDLLPAPYLRALSDLQDRLPSFPNEIAFAVIEEELGAPPHEIFQGLTPEPVAAASLGQVYRGVLRATGEEVAVKVQRPGIGEGMAIDMLLLRRLMGLVDEHLPQVSQPLVPLVDEFAARLFAELDYEQEGRNAERFQELYGGMPRVRTPAIKWQATRRRVLTMEWIEGIKLTNKEAMDAAGLSVVDFVDVGIECTLRQLLEHGYFHADPHPGNLLAARDGSLVYLDFGMMSTAPQYARYAIMAHVVHLVNRDYAAMCRDYYVLQFMDPSVDTSPIAPALQAFFDDVLGASVTQLNFKAIVDGLGDVLFAYPFRVPAYYALILRSLTVLEGLALQADPQYKLLAKAYPYMARRLLTDPAPELRASFEELVLDGGGKLRWNRLENLLREGSKSSDFDAAQLWLLGRWLLSDGGAGVRARLGDEAARLLDALAAEQARDALRARFGEAIAAALVPEQVGEAEARRRAEAVGAALTGRLPALGDGVGGAGGAGNIAGALALPEGTGPFGLLAPGDVRAWVDGAGAAAGASWPQLQSLLELPGTGELAADVASQLTRRCAARAIKLVFGVPDVIGGGGSAEQQRA